MEGLSKEALNLIIFGPFVGNTFGFKIFSFSLILFLSLPSVLILLLTYN